MEQRVTKGRHLKVEWLAYLVTGQVGFATLLDRERALAPPFLARRAGSGGCHGAARALKDLQILKSEARCATGVLSTILGSARLRPKKT